MASDMGGSVTLIFYKIGDRVWREPALNVLAAAFQWSSFTHVELAIGNAAGTNGNISNVVRIFNDDVGVELTQRTGRNPQYSYLSIGCSKAAEERMLAYARTLVGRPFSNAGMVRSIIYPRQTDEKSFFCAELVAAVLRVGGLLTQSSNPGSATPESLHRVFKNKAAVTANPYILRQFNANFHTPLGYETLQGSAASFAAATAATATADGAAMQQRVACGPPIARADNAGGLGGASGASGASGARQRTARRAPSPPRATILYRPL